VTLRNGATSSEKIVVVFAFYSHNIVNLIILKTAIWQRGWVRLSHFIQILWRICTKSMFRPRTLMRPLFVVSLEVCENIWLEVGRRSIGCEPIASGSHCIPLAFISSARFSIRLVFRTMTGSISPGPCSSASLCSTKM